MNTRNLLLGLTFFLAAALIAPSVAYLGNEPGTVIDEKDFLSNSFKTAMVSDEPGTIINIKDFAVDTFKTAMVTNEPATILNIKEI